MMDAPSADNTSKGKDLSDQLKRQGVIGGDDHNRALAEQFGMTIIQDITTMRLPKERYVEIPYGFVSKHVIMPIQEDEAVMTVAVADPLNLEPLEELRLMLNMDIKPVYCSADSIKMAIQECYNKEQGVASRLIADMDKRAEEGEEIKVYDLLDDTYEQAPIIKLLHLIIIEAIQQGASDIHFEPYENSLRVRYRIDGVLQNRHAPSQEYQQQLLTRIKVMSKLDIAERRLPQDGRIKLKMGNREIDFRVSTVPVAGGERIVLRILDKGDVVLGLDRLGMLQEVYSAFKQLIKLPEGIILITGPTGSGKTTTLYSAISDIYCDETNIMTIEDPVEYNLKGIAQIGVNSKIQLDFATGLRHILRQDPDVVMIGEIRDKETADIAIQASLTGHLVMSTLHTNDAPSAITRLVDMGIEPFLLSSTVVGVGAQRLVRRICQLCKESYKPSDEELKTLGIQRSELQKGELYHGKGCKECYDTGFKGRHGLYELMVVDNEIKKQINKSVDALEMREVAKARGMISLIHHGRQLAKKGVTTAAEVLRVCRDVGEIEEV